MKLYIYFLPILLFVSNISKAQKITVDKPAVDFGMIFTNDPDTIEVQITNNAHFTIDIIDINIFDTAFMVYDTAFSIPANSSVSFHIVFNPRHNIKYNTEAVIYAITNEGNISIDVTGTGKYTDTYYNATQNLSEESLKAALKSITGSGYLSLGYNLARDKMFMEIDNKKINGQGASQNTLECVYTGTLAVGYTSRADAQTTFNFNTEHTFPQGTFSQNEPMRSDLHHLFPTYEPANSTRGNDPFGYVSNPTWQLGGSKSNGSTFEPRDVHKGDAARAMLYFLIRYQNYQNYVSAAHQNILRDWAQQYLPDSIERKRNDDIFAMQKNRNPFIDHPEFLERIHNFIGLSQEPARTELIITSDTINFYETVAGNLYKYDLILVNTGNTNITISNLNIPNPSFTIKSADTLISPGEDGKIVVEYFSQVSQAETSILSFISNAFTVPASIPVIANIPPFVSVTEYPQPFLQLYPNPAEDYLYISGEHSEGLSYRILDISGREIQRSNLSSENKIPVNSLQEGLYIFQLKKLGVRYSYKFIKL